MNEEQRQIILEAGKDLIVLALAFEHTNDLGDFSELHNELDRIKTVLEVIQYGEVEK